MIALIANLFFFESVLIPPNGADNLSNTPFLCTCEDFSFYLVQLLIQDSLRFFTKQKFAY